jgi:prevent-host-death family protein
MKKMPAGEFKAHCLAIMDRVQKTKETVLITKHGRAVAKLIPADDSPAPFLGRLEGIVKVNGDLEAPVAPSESGGASR